MAAYISARTVKSQALSFVQKHLVVRTMAGYVSDVPALDPPASGAVESQVAAAIRRGDPIHADHMIAAKKQLKWREKAASLESEIVTDDEVEAAERRLHALKALHFDVSPDGEHVPRWVQLLQESIRTAQQESAQQVQQSIREAQQESAQQLQQIRESVLSIQQGVQQAKNRGLKNTNEKLTPVIRLLDGKVPANFPETPDALVTSPKQTVERLLRFYGLPNDETLPEMKAQLKAFCGINL